MSVCTAEGGRNEMCTDNEIICKDCINLNVKEN